MPVNTIKIISSTLKNARRLVKFALMGRDDVQEVNQVLPAGFDSAPIVGQVGFYSTTSIQGENIVFGYLNGNQIAAPGETAIYSTNADGDLAIRFHLRNDGTAELGGNSDFLVRYNKLNEGFEKLKEDFNNHLTAYNGHIHITTATVGPSPTPGVLSPTASTSTPSTASISAAKIDELKTS